MEVTLATNKPFRPEELPEQVVAEVAEQVHKEQVGHGFIARPLPEVVPVAEQAERWVIPRAMAPDVAAVYLEAVITAVAEVHRLLPEVREHRVPQVVQAVPAL